MRKAPLWTGVSKLHGSRRLKRLVEEGLDEKAPLWTGVSKLHGSRRLERLVASCAESYGSRYRRRRFDSLMRSAEGSRRSLLERGNAAFILAGGSGGSHLAHTLTYSLLCSGASSSSTRVNEQ